MVNLNIIILKEVGENQVIRSRVSKTQQPDAEGLIWQRFFLTILIDSKFYFDHVIWPDAKKSLEQRHLLMNL